MAAHETPDDNLAVKKSTIPGANLGLFAGPKGFLKDTCICEYQGEVLSLTEARKRRERGYLKMVSLNRHIDAVDPTKSSVARYANDNLDPEKINACFFTLRERVYLRASRDIAPGEEIFVSYGRGHWLFCTDLATAEGFLGLKRGRSGGTTTNRELSKGEMVCVYASSLWSSESRFGCGLGRAIERVAEGEQAANCELMKNPLLKGTTLMVRARRDISPGSRLCLSRENVQSMTGPPLFLISGFGKFAGVSTNPTTSLVKRLMTSSSAFELGILAGRVLRTDISTLRDELRMLEEAGTAIIVASVKTHPRVVYVHFGVFDGTDRFWLERRAANEATFFGIKDEGGNQPIGECVIGEEPFGEVRETGFDVEGIAQRMQSEGFSVDVSDDAGRFLCNYCYYTSLAMHEEALFVHVPSWKVFDADAQVRFAEKLLELLRREY